MIKLYLKNFRGVAEGSLELPDVSILVGQNGSGKSSILEAMFLAPGPLRTTPYGYPATMILEHIHEASLAEWRYLVSHGYLAEEVEVRLEVDGRECRMRMVDGELQYESIGEDAKLETLMWHPSLVAKAWDALPLRLTQKKDLMVKYVSILYHFMWERKEKIVGLASEPFAERGSSFVAVLEDGSRIRVHDLGDGARNLLALCLLYEISKPQILLIDDIEVHMNPRAMNLTLDWLSGEVEKGLRVVASTHSLEAVKNFLSRLDGSRAVLVGLKQGKLSYKTYTLDEVEELESAGLDLRVAEGYVL